MTENAKKKYDCATGPYPRYKEGRLFSAMYVCRRF